MTASVFCLGANDAPLVNKSGPIEGFQEEVMGVFKAYGVSKILVVRPLGHRNPRAMVKVRLSVELAMGRIGPPYRVAYADASSMSTDYYKSSDIVSI